jgi:MFS family permease
VIFLLGSGLSAAAQSMEQLVAFRGVQGLGAGALEGLTFILVADLYAGKRNAALQGAMAGLMGVSFILGPLLGGFIADGIGWRWVFLVNLPIGLVALAVVASVLPASIGRSEDRTMKLDLKGIALLTLAIGLVLIGLSEREAVLLIAGLVPLAAFVWVERRASAPIIPPALFAERKTGAILVAGAFGAFGMFASLLLLPRYFQTVEGASATHSGVLIYPLLIGLIISVNVAGGVIAKRGEYRTVVLAGMVLLALGALGFATFDAGTPKWESLLFMALIGLGVGPQLSGLQIAMMRLLHPARIGGGLGTLMLLRQVGAAVALAAAETIYARGDDPAVATGTGIVVIAVVGVVIASAALLSVPRPATRFALAT